MNAFTLLAALDSAVAVLAGVCARAEGRLESLMGAKGELSTPERLLQRFAAAHSGLSDLLDPPAPAVCWTPCSGAAPLRLPSRTQRHCTRRR